MLINNIRKSPTCPIRNTIHAPTRGATSAVAWKWKLHIISIHAPTRGATLSACKLLLRNSYFNPRSYKRSDLIVEISRFQPVDFNPRSYKRSDLRKTKAPAMLIISIHAPTRGATVSNNFSNAFNIFQSTLLQEERPSLSQSFSATLPISIHAPTRGATVCPFRNHNNSGYFNPRSYKRSDM